MCFSASNRIEYLPRLGAWIGGGLEGGETVVVILLAGVTRGNATVFWVGGGLRLFRAKPNGQAPEIRGWFERCFD